MPSEKVIELFKNFSGYNDRITRYQVEHIEAKEAPEHAIHRPNAVHYKLRVCTNPDKLCKRIHSPLRYYRKNSKHREKELTVTSYLAVEFI